METEITLKAGDVCLDCQQHLGIEKRLRYFKLNLNGDTLLKCESNECMYPYNDEMYSTDEEEEQEEDKDVQNLKFIDDFIQQYTNENVVQDSHNQMPNINENVTTQFDISFLDNFNDNAQENLCKTELTRGSNEMLDSKSNVQIIENEFLSLPVINSESESVIEMVNVKKQSLDENLHYKTMANSSESLPILFSVDYDIKPNIVKENNEQIPSFKSLKDVKSKIDIQSIETIDKESPLYNILPTTSKALTTNTELPSTSCKLSNKLATSSLESSLYNILSTPSKTPNTSSTSSNDASTKRSKSSLSKLPKSLDDSLSNIPTFTICTEISSISHREPNEISKLSSSLYLPKTSDISLKEQQPITSEITKSNEEIPKTSSLDIPKANIMKGRDFLKKLAIVDEKISKQNFNTIRKKKKTTNKEIIKHEQKHSQPSFSGNTTDFSLEKISEILMANRMKRENNK